MSRRKFSIRESALGKVSATGDSAFQGRLDYYRRLFDTLPRDKGVPVCMAGVRSIP